MQALSRGMAIMRSILWFTYNHLDCLDNNPGTLFFCGGHFWLQKTDQLGFLLPQAIMEHIQL